MLRYQNSREELIYQSLIVWLDIVFYEVTFKNVDKKREMMEANCEHLKVSDGKEG